ncbi:bifunctional diaminohydroxyphosphoribosylaminopyrimidine deaminase/5-amino-6-(5-phosphoribosylamino)uracil reductase RibD [Maricaulis maris]|uniref:diaminohydroxyphosphoribosylaminopyrimidine deaminase n=1 Tax=Maricaulis maris TaxID=74318 RepID=A0A495DLD4_9PROT|nr:bifunctional diaminohydroxyphosphoribosylaminopyrimidine deaminase/5-amino-6-(5-phosphoribosylamino)uracil reductase RibD [Maricaulis maris]RKR03724.1 diaminohydroxyphosphoribosylaminopyrimidine deaminase [Maricaulis maris]
MTALDDARYMGLALALARARQGHTAPNPAVGCVLVKNGRILATGATQDGGRPHAERVALDAAGAAAQGATAYVTLEPCAHHGQTPPCADALIAAAVSRVVIACLDRFPQVAGRGIARLEAAGIAVDTGLGGTAAGQLYAGFFSRVETGRPEIRVDARLRGYDATLTATTPHEAESELKAHGEAGRNRIRIAPEHPLAGRDWPTAHDR